jgi:ABC-type xylose transport system permease subunit
MMVCLMCGLAEELWASQRSSTSKVSLTTATSLGPAHQRISSYGQHQHGSLDHLFDVCPLTLERQAVIGGVSLFGGRGSVRSIVLVALIIGSLDKGQSLKSQETHIKYIVEGAELVLAVNPDALESRAQARSGR